jgi:outer membrane lipoprotein-sorting protein
MKRILTFIALCFLLVPPGRAQSQDAYGLVKASFNYWRGQTSMGEVRMTIHRPDWERTVVIRAWTKGEKWSLFYIVDPPKDRGNGTLKKGREMWIYNPKVNRIIKIPPSMMSQSWMGSDFSNDDLAKTESTLYDYTHTFVGIRAEAGKKIYRVKCVPKPEAPVVWGMQMLEIREDFIFLKEEFYDEELKPVKILTGSDIQMMGGKLIPTTWRMQKADVKDEYTVLEYRKLIFDLPLEDSLFTLSSLRNLPG